MTETSRERNATLEIDGCPIAYRVRGAGPPVVWIQGVAVQGEAWRPQIEELAARYRCLTFDNRGFGASVPAGAAITVERMAADTLALMDHLGWESAHLVGHSLGGQVALEIALTARSRVRTLALLCTFFRGRDAVALSAAKVWIGLRTYVGTRRMRRRAFLEMVMPASELASSDRDELAAELAGLFGHDLADHPAVERAQLSALRRYDASSRLGSLAGLPTLVISAHEDRIARPDSGLALSAAIPGSLFLDIPDAGHGVPIQKPEEVNRRLEQLFVSAPDRNSERVDSDAGGGAMEDPAALVRRWFEVVWNQGSEAAMENLLHYDAEIHGLAAADGVAMRGPTGFKPVFRQFKGAFPDIRITVTRTVTEGAMVAAHCEVTGTHLGDTLGIPPTGRRVEFQGMVIVRTGDGRIQEGWNCFDFLAMYQQLGIAG